MFALCAILTYSCSPESLNSDVETLDETALVIPETKTIEAEILALINDYRTEEGLNRLERLTIVKSAAHTHTDYMVDNKAVSHANFFVRSNFLKENAGAKSVSENVAFGFTSAASVVKAWIKSESHRKNMIGDYTNFEISAEQDIDGKWYYTNMFIKK
jgi:uncharacterized protein YkwD